VFWDLASVGVETELLEHAASPITVGADRELPWPGVRVADQRDRAATRFQKTGRDRSERGLTRLFDHLGHCFSEETVRRDRPREQVVRLPRRGRLVKQRRHARLGGGPSPRLSQRCRCASRVALRGRVVRTRCGR
jgi:hypothetical protein